MQLWSVLVVLGLLLLDRSEAHGSAASGSGHIELRPWGLGGQSLAELVRGRGRFGGGQQSAWVEVRASSAGAPKPGAEAYNEVTVAVRAIQPIWKISLSLPERTICRDSNICMGYSFNEVGAIRGHCDIVPWDYKRLKLPRSKSQVVDIQNHGLIDKCQVNNSLALKRPEMLMVIRQDVLADLVANSWLVFKIKVLNPAETPADRPGRKAGPFKANTWLVQLQSSQGEVIELPQGGSLPAPQILSLWHCNYTNWMWTTPCTAKCGGGVRYSIRRLLHPPPLKYPRDLLVHCNEPLSQTHPCNEDPCIVDCKLGDWTSFADGPCSSTCGKGFQVERRRVVEGPVGKGKLCPPHDKPNVRVRYKECNEKECEPRCSLASKAVLYGQCSEVCNNQDHGNKEPSTRDSVRVVTWKDNQATLKTCGAEHQKAPCGVYCDAVNFFPAQTGRLPRAGKWAEMVMVFFLDDLAQGLIINAPKGFEIGNMQSPDGGDKMCLLSSHNIPRLKRCIVNVTDDRYTMTIDLLNSLEGVFPTESGGTRRQKYEVVFWIKSPVDCLQGFDEHGACKVPQGSWNWQLQIWSMENGGSTVVDDQSTFKVYNEHSTEKDWIQVPAGDNVGISNEDNQARKQDFLMGVSKREAQLSGQWVYVQD